MTHTKPSISNLRREVTPDLGGPATYLPRYLPIPTYLT